MQFHGGVSLSRLCVCVSACGEWIDTTLRIPRALRQLFAKIEHSEAAMATTGCILKQSFHHKGDVLNPHCILPVTLSLQSLICSKSSTKRVCSQESTEDRPDSFSVRISFLQIYQDAAWAAEVVAVPTMSFPQEKIYDLLNPAPFLQGLTHAGSPDRLGPFLGCFGVVLSSQNRQRSQNSTLAEILC